MKKTSYISKQQKLASVICFYAIAIIALSIVQYQSGYFNNYLIFSRPYILMHHGQSIYGFHLEYYMDTFKYSPSFAFAFGLFSYLPDYIGIMLWNALNSGLVVGGVLYYFEQEQTRITALLMLAPFVLLSAFDLQSNGLLAGGILLAAGCMERQKLLAAAAILACLLFIKIYGFAAIALIVPYPRRALFGGYVFLCICIVGAFPLVLLSPDYLLQSYSDWWTILCRVHYNVQSSVMGIAQSWLNIRVALDAWAAFGMIVCLLPLTAFRLFRQVQYRQTMAASLLMGIVLFNKMAEAPTYLIAAAGLVILMQLDKRLNAVERMLAVASILAGIISLPVWPRIILDKFMIPFSIITVPFLLLWIALQIRLWRMEFSNPKAKESQIDQPPAS